MSRSIAAMLVGLALVLTGCGLTGGVSEMPLPGGADLGDRPITIRAEFGDVLDLVPHSAVQLDNVPVGEVTRTRVGEDGRSAVVTMRIRGDLELGADTTARIRQTSLLGEKYVSLEPGTSTEPLADGAYIERVATSQAVSAEEVLGALSTLLNGGGVAQFQTISRELRRIGGGRTGDVRAFLEEMGTFVRDLDRRRSSITDAIDGLHGLASTLASRRADIDDVLVDLAPGIDAIADQRGELVRMLRALDRLSGVSLDVLQRAGDDIAADLGQLAPVLDKLADTGQDLPRSLEVALTFPFTDEVLRAIRGDYLNVYVTLNLSATGTLLQPDDTWPYRTDAAPTRSAPPLLFEAVTP